MLSKQPPRREKCGYLITLVLFFAGEGRIGDIYRVRNPGANVIERDIHAYKFDFPVATFGEKGMGV